MPPDARFPSLCPTWTHPLARSRRFRVSERSSVRRALVPTGWLTVAALLGGAAASAITDPLAGPRLLLLNGTSATIIAVMLLNLRTRSGARHAEMMAGALAILVVIDLFVAGLLSPTQLRLSATIMPLLPLLFALFLPVKPSAQLAQIACAGVATAITATLLAGSGDTLLANGTIAAYVVGALMSMPGHELLRRQRLENFAQLMQIQRLHRGARTDGRQLQTLNDRLVHSARVDALTGVGNRLQLREDLVRLAARHDLHLGFILLDLDHFKGFNDARGHIEGDDVLGRVGDVLRSSVRERDRAYRYGGEEFLILVTGEEPPPAADVADRVRRAIAALAIAHPANDGWGRVTVSAGVALRKPSTATPLKETLHAADQALFAAKHAGRNRVAISATSEMAVEGTGADVLRGSVVQAH